MTSRNGSTGDSPVGLNELLHAVIQPCTDQRKTTIQHQARKLNEHKISRTRRTRHRRAGAQATGLRVRRVGALTPESPICSKASLPATTLSGLVWSSWLVLDGALFSTCRDIRLRNWAQADKHKHKQQHKQQQQQTRRIPVGAKGAKQGAPYLPLAAAAGTFC